MGFFINQLLIYSIISYFCNPSKDNVLNIYSKKQVYKYLLLIVAILIGIASLLYTNRLIKKLSVEERKKVELWAEGMKRLTETDNQNQDYNFIFKVIENNETIPVIVVDSTDEIIFYRNLDSLKAQNPEYLKGVLNEMKKNKEPIKIKISDNYYQTIYYEDSVLLKQLFYYPFIELFVVFLFIFVAYLAFSSTRKAEQNQVWVGLSKETAHQLGTPISSLLAMIELLKMQNTDTHLVDEIDKDVKRLEKITERFSKIGATPKLENSNIVETLINSVNYIKTRSSKKVKFIFNNTTELIVPHNIQLFEWVIENLCKNSIDAMNGEGEIKINVIDNYQHIYIDICDTGKGIQKSKFKAVFNPGYTTKKRGWGLGLSLTKRIIENYHNGKIFVKSSEINKGTCFRIVLKKQV